MIRDAVTFPVTSTPAVQSQTKVLIQLVYAKYDIYVGECYGEKDLLKKYIKKHSYS
jgi:hypothetical protein